MTIGFWTDERMEICQQALREGKSGLQIAALIGAPSRNAVIGKVNRMGWRGLSPNTRPRHSGTKVEKPKKMKAPPPSLEEQTPSVLQASISATASTSFAFTGPKTFGELAGDECKWPIGDPMTDDFTFCGRGSGGDGPYCRAHAQFAYQPSSSRTSAKNLERGLYRQLR